jgi:hypothetical protein
MFEEFRNILFMLKITGGIDGRKRFQKIAYLMKEAGFPFEEKFEWNNFGPFSRELSLKITALCEMGLVKENVVESNGNKEYSYELTPKGMEIAEKMQKSDTALYKSFGVKLPELIGFETTDLERIASIKYLSDRGCTIDYMSVFLEYTKNYQKKDVLSGKKTMEDLFNVLTI